MWQLPDGSSSLGKSSRRPAFGPLGAIVERVFSNLIYQDISGPLPVTVWCNPDTVIIMAKINHLQANEIDITVSDMSLELMVVPYQDDEAGFDAAFLSQPQKGRPYTISLPYPVDLKQVDAELSDNLLHIKLVRFREEEIVEWNDSQALQ